MGKRVFRDEVYRTEELRDQKPRDIILMYIFFFFGGVVGTYIILFFIKSMAWRILRRDITQDMDRLLGSIGQYTYGSVGAISLTGGILSVGYLIVMRTSDPFH